MHSVCIVGHRGCGSDGSAKLRGVRARENTLLSFQLAHKLGAHYVEFDVQLSADGIPVIYHDWGVLVPVPGGLPVRVPVGRISLAGLQSFHAPEILNGKGLRSEGTALAYSRKPSVAAPSFDSCADFSRNVRACAALGLHVPVDIALVRHSPVLGDRGQATSMQQGLTDSAQARKVSRLLYTLQQDYSYGLHDAFTTLETLLRVLPSSLGFNIELKYPGPDELQHYALQGSVPSKEEYIEKVMTVVARYMLGESAGRALIFSSFDPDVCVACKQWIAAHASAGTGTWTVMFLTEGGTHSGALSDPRMVSLPSALDFAHGHGLQGVVTHAPALWGQASDTAGDSSAEKKVLCVQEWVKKADDLRLRLFTYGFANMDMDLVRIQAQAGIQGIITDHVKETVQALRAS